MCPTVSECDFASNFATYFHLKKRKARTSWFHG